MAVSLSFVFRPLITSSLMAEWDCWRSQLGVYGTTMGTFHLLEFWITAHYNPQKLSVDGRSTMHSEISD